MLQLNRIPKITALMRFILCKLNVLLIISKSSGINNRIQRQSIRNVILKKFIKNLNNTYRVLICRYH